MTIFNVITLFGGLALFLYGMQMMGDGLKKGSSDALKRAMEKVTNNPLVGFFLGLAVTAVIQSSTATIVLTSGLVGAGILTLRQSIGIILLGKLVAQFFQARHACAAGGDDRHHLSDGGEEP